MARTLDDGVIIYAYNAGIFKCVRLTDANFRRTRSGEYKDVINYAYKDFFERRTDKLGLLKRRGIVLSTRSTLATWSARPREPPRFGRTNLLYHTKKQVRYFICKPNPLRASALARTLLRKKNHSAKLNLCAENIITLFAIIDYIRVSLHFSVVCIYVCTRTTKYSCQQISKNLTQFNTIRGGAWLNIPWADLFAWQMCANASTKEKWHAIWLLAASLQWMMWRTDAMSYCREEQRFALVNNPVILYFYGIIFYIQFWSFKKSIINTKV